MRRCAPEMRASVKLSLYGALLVAVFATAFVVARVVVPEETAQTRAAETDDTPERDTSRTAAVDSLLYLDFRVDSTVHTAEFVVDGDGYDHGE